MIVFETDEFIRGFLKHILFLFKNIHPNVITIFGIIMNILIFFLFKNKYITLLNIALLIRYLCDTLDGFVARTFNKSSEIGGYLDTLNDLMLVLIYSYLILNNYTNNNKLIFSILFIIFSLFLYIMISRGTLSNHQSLKYGEKINLTDKFIKFFINNVILFYFILIIFNIFFIKN